MSLCLEKSQKAANSLLGHTDGNVGNPKAHRKTDKKKDRIQKVSNTLPGTGLEATNIIFWQRVLLFYSCPEITSEVKFRSNRPICLLEADLWKG